MAYFTEAEFACRCRRLTCPAPPVDATLLDKLNALRGELARPIHVVSGSRCPQQNHVVGGVDDSAHLTGKAADLYVPTGRERWAFLHTILANNLFTRVGIGKTFIHVDVDTSKSGPSIWLY